MSTFMSDAALRHELTCLKNFLGLCVMAPAGQPCTVKGPVDGCFACVDPREAKKRVQRILCGKSAGVANPLATHTMAAAGGCWTPVPANLFLRASELPIASGNPTQPVYFRAAKRALRNGRTYIVHAIAFANRTIWTAEFGFEQKCFSLPLDK